MPKKLVVHTHHIASHFTNGLMPVGTVLLTLYFITGKATYEISAFYCFIFAALGSPFSFLSGVIDWKTRFMGRKTRIFNHKRFFGLLFVILSTVIVVWRLVDPSVANLESEFRYLYLGLVYLNLTFGIYLGHLGGKFI